MKKLQLGFVILLIFLMAGCSGGGTGDNSSYTVSGRIVDKNSSGIEGVSLHYGDGSVTTDSNGFWTITGLSGEVTITPVKEGMAFIPDNYVVTGDKSDLLFLGSLDIRISLDIEPYWSDTQYKATASIRRFSENAEQGEFANAEIIVNGLQLQYDPQDDYFFYNDTELVLNTGDQVEVSISHPELGLIADSVTVPPSVPEITTQDDITQFVNGEISSITLSWNPVYCDGYMVWIICYKEGIGKIFSSGYSVEENTFTFDSSDLINEDKGEKADYAGFVVEAYNQIELPEYFGFSGITVFAPSSPEINNLP